MKYVISGATGFIGTHLIPALQQQGHEVVLLTRTADSKRPGNAITFHWDPMAAEPPAESLKGADGVIHLAGENVAQRWNDDVKRKIRDSRVIGTRNLVNALAAAQPKPAVLVCASATGYYGSRGDEDLDESSAPGDGFLSRVCIEWEREADRASALGIRLVKIRTGIALGLNGGMLAKVIPAFKAKTGGKLGSGKQWMSWIHIDDLIALYLFALSHDMTGVFDGTAPNPATNAGFTEALSHALKQPSLMTVPEFMLKMMFGEMAEVMLGSQRVLPKATEAAGFHFEYPEIHGALNNLIG